MSDRTTRSDLHSDNPVTLRRCQYAQNASIILSVSVFVDQKTANCSRLRLLCDHARASNDDFTSILEQCVYFDLWECANDPVRDSVLTRGCPPFAKTRVVHHIADSVGCSWDCFLLAYLPSRRRAKSKGKGISCRGLR